MKLLRYEDPETLINTYVLANNEFFEGKDSKYIFVVKENATMQDLKANKHDIKHLNLTYNLVVL